MALRSQPPSTNSRASQSSNSGWDGNSPWIAEVFGRLDEADAEVTLPDAIHRDAGRQGVLGRHQPAGQTEAVVPCIGGHRAADSRARRARPAASCPASRNGRGSARMCRARRPSLLHHHHRGLAFLELRLLLAELLELSLPPSFWALAAMATSNCTQTLPRPCVSATWRQRRHVAALLVVHPLLVDAVEEGEELVELVLRDRVELVIVAAAATHRQAEEHRRRGLDAIDGVLDAPFLVDRARLR